MITASTTSCTALSPVELRIGVLPQSPAEPISTTAETLDCRAYLEASVKWRLQQRRQGQHSPPASAFSSLPHIALSYPSNRTDALYDLVHSLPHAILALSHFAITPATDGATLCDSLSFDTQPLLDAALVDLPLHTPLSVRGRAAPVERGMGKLLEDVMLSFNVTLHEV